MLNTIIMVFIAIMAWWWTTQGLLSGFIHLILTIFAGAIALAFWEPLVNGFLIDRMPEYAWGVGLLVPFIIALLTLRWAADKFVPGNINFPHIADMIGGGVTGFASAVLTAGLLVIGLQMVGLPDLFGYQPYTIAPTGQELTANDRLYIPVDTITANFFASLSTGSLSPGENSLHRYHPDLAVESAFFHADPNPSPATSRRTIDPDSGSLIDGEILPLTELPPSLTKLAADKTTTHIIGTRIIVVHGNANMVGAADIDGTFRISRSQVALVYTPKDGSGSRVTFPLGFIQGGEYISMASGDSASSGESNNGPSTAAPATSSDPAAAAAAAVDNLDKNPKTQTAAATSAPAATGPTDTATHIAWVFQTPEGAKPLFIRVKSLRLMLPQPPDKPAAELAIAAERMLYYVATATATDTTPIEINKFITVSDRLPFSIDKNALSLSGNATLKDGGIVLGFGTAKRETAGVPRELAIDHVSHTDNQLVVTVDLGLRSEKKSLLGRILALPGNITPPVLIDTNNQTYWAIGFAVVTSKELVRFKIDPNQTIRSLVELDFGRLTPNDQLLLYYHVPKGATLIRFQLGAGEQTEIPGGLLVKP